MISISIHSYLTVNAIISSECTVMIECLSYQQL
uniref:Uncharacterized protein n=1 Tax=viral metagenome TaxID=1070528 RepID=A0A6C0BLS8_9ZZZZ